ncbi:MAG: T9SS type A sorting domain-containing protein [Prevotella sp.]|uniref:T9SS type A sorting domain-containing protein n=1 Tax=Prevotella sp. TaxID=59823 RepID=UPI0025FF4EEB|nr:T9SS type A sorting domain-containing protein [Prevotella sp.]MCI7118750.1 T9SS type A sorting domain-containing protein [Prevotella sp.]
MKRFTFSVMLALATIVAHAENVAPTWTANLTTTEKATDLQRGAAMTIDNEGNSIVTGTYTKDIEFASSYLEPIATSAFIAKYDKAGNKKWAAGLKGAATITTITNDAEGNVYAAGVFADKVAILNAKGEEKENITGMADQKAQVSGFIVKYNKEGEYVASKVVIPEQVRNDEGYGDPNPNFIPSKLIASNGKVYLAASFQGNVKINDLALVGQYGSLYGIYTWDVPTFAIVSLSDNFDKTELVAQLAATDMETEVGYGTEVANFTTDGSKVYAAFVAYGNDLTLKSANDFKQITDLLNSVTGEETKYEHAYIFATIENGNITATKTYHSKIDNNLREAKFNTIDQMAFNNGNLYLAGTFNETFPFDNTKAYVGGCDTYIASLKATDLSKNWVLTSGYDEGDVNKKAEVVTGMAVFNGEVQLTGWAEQTSGHVVETPLNFYIDTETVPTEMKVEAGADAIFATSVAHNGIYTIALSDNRTMIADEDKAKEGIYTYSFYNDDEETGVKQIAANDNNISWNGNTVTLAKAADIYLYTASGMLVKKANNASSMSLANVAAGIYMVKAGKQTIKIVK